MEKICAFTGHRDLEKDFNAEKLLSEILRAIDEGYTTFLCGMAVGFDLLAAEFVLMLKEENPKLKLLPCIPCEGQDKYYSAEDKMRYHAAMLVCEEQVVLSPYYYRGCMQVRDRYMAERADRLIAYCNKDTGGTAYTVKYFQKCNPNGRVMKV